jgi:4-oxalocrotonate tautomerase
MKVLDYGEESVSVVFEEVDANEWGEKVYEPDIVRKGDTLYKNPGYTM